jgi:hypothetical protein
MNIVDRVKNILMSPKTEWPAIAAEPADIGSIMMNYVLPLAAIPAVAQVIGLGLIGRATLTYGVATAVVSFVTAIVGVFLAAYVIDMLAPSFGSEKNLERSVQLVAYSMTPGWIAGVLHIFTALGALVLIASLYGLYLLFLGVMPVKKTPQDKQVPYLVVSIVVILVVYIILGMILGGLMLAIFGLATMTGAM